MAFNYDRVFVVLDENGEIQGIYKNKDYAIESLPEAKARAPRQLKQHGDWAYGKSKPWLIVEKKIKDSSGIPSVG